MLYIVLASPFLALVATTTDGLREGWPLRMFFRSSRANPAVVPSVAENNCFWLRGRALVLAHIALAASLLLSRLFRDCACSQRGCKSRQGQRKKSDSFRPRSNDCNLRAGKTPSAHGGLARVKRAERLRIFFSERLAPARRILRALRLAFKHRIFVVWRFKRISTLGLLRLSGLLTPSP